MFKLVGDGSASEGPNNRTLTVSALSQKIGRIFLETINSSRAKEAAAIIAISAVVVTVVFLLASNPVGWAATALLVTVVAAKVLFAVSVTGGVACVFYAGKHFLVGQNTREELQKVSQEDLEAASVQELDLKDQKKSFTWESVKKMQGSDLKLETEMKDPSKTVKTQVVDDLSRYPLSLQLNKEGLATQNESEKALTFLDDLKKVLNDDHVLVGQVEQLLTQRYLIDLKNVTKFLIEQEMKEKGLLKTCKVTETWGRNPRTVVVSEKIVLSNEYNKTEINVSEDGQEITVVRKVCFFGDQLMQGLNGKDLNNVKLKGRIEGTLTAKVTKGSMDLTFDFEVKNVLPDKERTEISQERGSDGVSCRGSTDYLIKREPIEEN